MQGTITIELSTTTPDTGSGLPDLGHTAYWLTKILPDLEYKDANGKMRRLGEKYKVSQVGTSAE